jgi:hypothetical protein
VSKKRTIEPEGEALAAGGLEPLSRWPTLGYWPKQFHFTEEQRERLKRAGWQRRAAWKEAEQYLDGLEEIVGSYLARREVLPLLTDRTLRTKAGEVGEVVRELREALATMPKELALLILPAVETVLHIEDRLRLRWPGRVSGRRARELLEFTAGFALPILESAARSIAEQEPQSGVKNDHERFLIFHAANCWVSVFGKVPSSGNGSSFRRMLRELSAILERDFGAIAAQDVVEHLASKKARPGAANQKKR